MNAADSADQDKPEGCILPSDVSCYRQQQHADCDRTKSVYWRFLNPEHCRALVTTKPRRALPNKYCAATDTI